MVVFHSYVSLPEGITFISFMANSKPQTYQTQVRLTWLTQKPRNATLLGGFNRSQHSHSSGGWKYLRAFGASNLGSEWFASCVGCIPATHRQNTVKIRLCIYIYISIIYIYIPLLTVLVCTLAQVPLMVAPTKIASQKWRGIASQKWQLLPSKSIGYAHPAEINPKSPFSHIFPMIFEPLWMCTSPISPEIGGTNYKHLHTLQSWMFMIGFTVAYHTILSCSSPPPQFWGPGQPPFPMGSAASGAGSGAPGADQSDPTICSQTSFPAQELPNLLEGKVTWLGFRFASFGRGNQRNDVISRKNLGGPGSFAY